MKNYPEVAIGKNGHRKYTIIMPKNLKKSVTHWLEIGATLLILLLMFSNVSVFAQNRKNYLKIISLSQDTQIKDTFSTSILWSQEKLNVTLFPGDTITRDVTLSTKTDIQGLSISVTPELLNTVKVTPDGFSNLKVNLPQTVHLTFHVPSGKDFALVNGTVHIRIGSSTLSKPLKIALNIGLPNDPGTIGKQTLAGIDSDADGVRDDIQRYIALSYPESAKTRAALYQYAIATQNFILQSSSKSASLLNSEAQDKAADCFSYLSSGAGYEITSELRARLLNTLERSRAYIKADSQLSGEVFELTPDSQKRFQCNFNPDTMED